jgi:hypothetical protein
MQAHNLSPRAPVRQASCRNHIGRDHKILEPTLLGKVGGVRSARNKRVLRFALDMINVLFAHQPA